MEDSKTEELSNPDNDRIKRKQALNEARQKLALRKKQREELRAQRAARLNGKIDIYTSSTSTSSSSSINNQKAAAIKKQQSLFAFTDLEEKPSKPSNVPNKASLLRAPRKRSMLSQSKLWNYRHTPEKTVVTFDKQTDTSFDMFEAYLKEQYNEEFPKNESIPDEVKANFILSKYKMGWPKELWMHEKSLSPSPQNLMYGDDEEFIEQQQKIELLKKQEKERKQRQFEMIQERRKLRLDRKNRKVLPDEEANLLINTGTFLENFRKKTKWMERTLGINSTHFASGAFGSLSKTAGNDNIDDMYDDDDGDDGNYDDDNKYDDQPPMRRSSTLGLQRRKRKNLLKYANKFSTTETEGRAIGDINFSQANTDWFLASYFTKEVVSDMKIEEDKIGISRDQNDGTLLIWNLILPSFPEYTLYSQSMITSSCFHPTDKFLVFASTISGQILCYDLRNGEQSKPVQRTNFSDGHSSGVFSMDFLQSATNSRSDRRHILSVSNDGKLCIWKDDGLDEKPMHEGKLQLTDNTQIITTNDSELLKNGDGDKKVTISTGGPSQTSEDLQTTCFGYQHKHSENILFGSDSGKIFRTDIHGNAKDEFINVAQSIEAHFGPVTNIDFPKYLNSMKDSSGLSMGKISSTISGLYLTSSYDWSVKLWHSEYKQCIETYTQMSDYVYDVKWCNGGKPGIFACCDGESKITLFDLKYDFKEPISAAIKVPTNNNSEEGTALTKLQWGNNGKYLSTGDSDGNIYLYISSNDLLYPKQNDFDNLDKAVKSTINSRIKAKKLVKLEQNK